MCIRDRRCILFEGYFPVLLSARILQAGTPSSMFVAWTVPFFTSPSSISTVETIPPLLVVPSRTSIFRSYKINPRAGNSIVIIIIITMVISIGLVISFIITGVGISLTIRAVRGLIIIVTVIRIWVIGPITCLLYTSRCV